MDDAMSELPVSGDSKERRVENIWELGSHTKSDDDGASTTSHTESKEDGTFAHEELRQPPAAYLSEKS